MNAVHRRWIAKRDAAVWAPDGIASLAATHWLDDVEQQFDGMPGWWRSDGSAAVGRSAPGDLRLEPGEEARIGDLTLRGMARDGTVAVRLWDPDAASHRGISAIARAPYDPPGGSAESSRP